VSGPFHAKIVQDAAGLQAVDAKRGAIMHLNRVESRLFYHEDEDYKFQRSMGKSTLHYVLYGFTTLKTVTFKLLPVGETGNCYHLYFCSPNSFLWDILLCRFFYWPCFLV
jgi:hypothetical protein